jgi:hypothetical protein
VEVFFSVYEGMSEEIILNLMDEKMLPNQLFIDQEFSEALVPKDAGNILQWL